VSARGVAAVALIVTLGFAMLAFGATEPWSSAWVQCLAWATLALAVWHRPELGALPPTARRLLWPAGAVVVLGLVQLVPLPTPVLRALSPNTAALYVDTVVPGDRELVPWLGERFEGAGDARIDPDAPPPDLPQVDPHSLAGHGLSVAPHATREALAGWLTALALFAAAASIGSDRLLRYRVLWGITLLGGALGALGMAQKLSWNGRLLWIRDRPPGTLPLGPFVNPSQYAGFATVTALVGIGLALALVSHARKGEGLGALRRALFDDHWSLPRVLLAGSCSLLAVAGLVASRSRGGWLAFGAALVFLLVGRRSRAWAGVALLSVALLGSAVGLVAWIGYDEPDIEGVPFVVSNADPSGALRLSAWGSTLRMFVDHPGFGTGMGSFRWMFPRYQRAGEWKEWDHAHNDYVEWLAETGLVGAAILIWALAIAGRRAMGSVLGGAHPMWTSAALAAALFAALAHAVVDFNLHVPSYAALMAVVCGLLVSAADDRSAATEDGR